ncbi:hypothetical protein N9J02_01525 [bacterium]|jgi:hypothetical protein|nr:hypothetical protein [bacterium]
MAISDSQKVDLLWKKVGFGKVKTDSNDNKKAPNEAISSDFIIKANQIWTNASTIPSTMPSSSASPVTVYTDSTSNTVETTEDGTSSDNRTWKTGTTNWIPPSFGATYQVKVYATTTGSGSPQGGSQLFETGSGNDDQWYFDYSSGVLHFIGTNLPSAIGTGTSNVIYVSGARYTGTTGVGDASASQTYIKSNLAAVYSDSDIQTGDIIKVTADTDGEYAVYLADQANPTQLSHLTLISTKDGAQTDSNTLRANVTYNGGNVTLGDVSTTSRPQEVVVDVTTAFDGSSTVNVGDDNDNDRLMTNDYIDLGTVGTYTVTPKFVYMDTTDANNTIKAYVVAGTSSQGAASIMITYS